MDARRKMNVAICVVKLPPFQIVSLNAKENRTKNRIEIFAFGLLLAHIHRFRSDEVSQNNFASFLFLAFSTSLC